MALPKGVFKAVKKDGTFYYRTSITYRGKHISLGSFDDPSSAARCFHDAQAILYSSECIDDYKPEEHVISFDKWVSLINYRDTGMYFKTPIYLFKKYFFYYLSKERALKFDADDLFYYSNHSIMVRNGYLFVADYGMQVNILSRYGIRSHAVEGRDYIFANGDNNDFTYKNIVIINRYYGVERTMRHGRTLYRARIHINGNYIIGYYDNEETAAIAYNKAADTLKKKGVNKKFPENYIENISTIEYAKIYNSIKISNKLRDY